MDEDRRWSEVAVHIAAETGLTESSEIHTRWAKLLGDRMDAVIAGDAPWVPHHQLVSESLIEAVTSLGGTLSSVASSMTRTLDREYAAWPEVADATAALRRSRLVADLSNGDLESLRAGAERPAKTDSFDLKVADLSALLKHLT